MGITKFLRIGGGKELKRYKARVTAINALEPEMEAKSDDELLSLSLALQERAHGVEANPAEGVKGRDPEPLDRLLNESFALMREVARRTIGLRHYDVQLIGAMALNDGSIAEMKTGEGKTLVSTCAGYLNALGGNNCHIVTVNDYLAKRDAEWMGKTYAALGMKVGLIQQGLQTIQRQPQYKCAVTYGTNSEFGFDYLRDNMVSSPGMRVQQGHHFAIVDEVDSILIDEARTPLIISGKGEKAAETYRLFASIMPRLKEERDFILDDKRRTIYPTEEGLDRIEEMLKMDIYSDLSGQLANHLQQALRAEFLFKLNHDYVVVEGELKIVDEFTGRIMEGRRYSEGLHQALEAKEHLEVKDESRTLATVTLQNYFRLYEKLSGMTGTAATEDAEFREIYHIPVVEIPTNRPVIRRDQNDYIYRTIEDKYNAVAKEVQRRHETGQPVLVGTSSIEGSERLSEKLKELDIPHEVLNAKEHEREADIVAQAGRLGAVTIATNMAGRGTDILLGGNPQGMLNELTNTFSALRKAPNQEHVKELSRKFAYETAEREGAKVRELGGLLVIGTDRHESRRIDNQLRGRSGRQGDPGESRFYLSLEDNLLRRFGKERLHLVDEMMAKENLSDDVPLEDPLVSKVIGSAQQQVETMHFSARKHVLEYDDVMNLQRITIYDERNAILDGKDLNELLPDLLRDTIDYYVDLYCPDEDAPDDWDWEQLNAWVISVTGAGGFDAREFGLKDADEIGDRLEELLGDILEEKREILGDEEFDKLERMIMLRVMDNQWLLHLQDMDYLKQGIGLRAAGHLDPLVEYKDAAYDAFGALAQRINEEFLTMLLRLQVERPAEELAPKEEDNPFRSDQMIYSNVEEALNSSSSEADVATGDQRIL